jgi:hypothetical protein
MERIGIVTNNPHLKSELGKWFTEIPGEFKFVDLKPVIQDPALSDSSSTASFNSADEKLRLAIFDSSSGYTLSKLRDDLNLSNIPWLAIGLEEHAHNPHVAAVNGADDLILVPLDRLVFLQKVEYLLAGDGALTPSFLYSAKAEFPVELAKAVHITHLSETGCSIHAPLPLATGVEGTLLSRIFGVGALERIEVRSVGSTPIDNATTSPQGEKHAYEIQLLFFGLKHSQLTEIRKWLSQHIKGGLPDIVRSAKEPKNKVHVALISPQAGHIEKIQSSLEDLAKFEFEEFGGFNRFNLKLTQRAMVPGKKGDPVGPPSTQLWSKEFIGPKTPAESRRALPHALFTLMVRLGSDQTPAHAESSTPTLRPGEVVLGSDWSGWQRGLDPLIKAMREDDRTSFDEAVQWTLSNSSVTKHPEASMTADVSVVDSTTGVCVEKLAIQLRISLVEAASPSKPALIKIQLEESADEKSIGKTDDGQMPYEAILIDGSLLLTELKIKIHQVSLWLEQYNIRNSFGNRSPIIVFNASEEKIDPQLFRGTKVRQMAFDFPDRRYQAELFISLSRPELWTSPNQSVVDLATDLTAYLGRPALATAVSEVGIVVKDHAPLRRGTELLILCPIWSQAPEGLWARLRTATQKEEDFDNEFVFFGVSDLVQKEVRKFTREDYIKKKTQGQG